jgi:hypothetical protein
MTLQMFNPFSKKRAPMKPIHPAEQFANAVQNEGLETNDAVARLACQHRTDRQESEQCPTPFFEFDESAASAAVALLAPLNPSPAEQFFTWYAFGWKIKATGARRFNKSSDLF